MSRNLFIADTHIGHSGISNKFRKMFSSDEEHDAVIIENIRFEIKKRDTLWILGDSVMKSDKFNMFSDIFNSTMVTNIILGNHCHKDFPRFCLSFPNVNVFGLQKKFGFWLTHAPIHPDELYRGLCVHGHLHDKVIDDPRYFGVSCEQVGYKPISLTDIREQFIKRGVL